MKKDNSRRPYWQRLWQATGTILVILPNFFCPLFAQSFTYFSYQAPEGEQATYEGLLTILDNGSATARVKNKAQPTQNALVFELALTDSIPVSAGNKRYLVPSGISDVSTLSDAVLTSPPLFEFEGTLTAQGQYFTLSKIYCRQGAEWAGAGGFEKKEYAYAEIKTELVEGFYAPDDPFYVEYFSAPREPDMAGRGWLGTSDRKRKFFLLIVADVQDETMGMPCRLDMENMANLFTNMVKEMDMIPKSPIITYLTGERFNKKSVLNAINGLKPGKNDIIVFYYTGHGYRDSGDTKTELPKMILGHHYQTLSQLHSISLSVQDVVDMLKKKGNSFNLVINDCCNVEMPAPSERPDGRQGLTTPKSIPARIYPKNFEQLFIKPKGTLVFSSAGPKQYSVGNPLLGGFFTWHFRITLRKYLAAASPKFTWENVFIETAKSTTWQAKTGLCPKGSDTRCTQVPQIFSYLK